MDLALLRAEYQLQSEERLVQDLKRHGDSEESLIQWLGHPIEEMTGEEQQILAEYVDRMDEARSQGKDAKVIQMMRPKRRPRTKAPGK